VAIALDETRRTQHMWIMNLVWPLCALFGSVLWLVFYLRQGRGMTDAQLRETEAGEMEAGEMEAGGMEAGETPMAVAVAKGSSHCGAGCALGDMIAEWFLFLLPGAAVALGWHSLFAHRMFAAWLLDYIVAFGLGIAFQYFSIRPMRDLPPGRALVDAIKADTASITSWQIGMYGFMAVAQLLWFPTLYGGPAPVDTPEFWFAMQIAMLCGFCTAYPVNWLLVRAGVKEKM